MASSLFARVHIGYIAAIVAAANAGGAGSVIGDTTTVMMWIDGASPADVLQGDVGATTASHTTWATLTFARVRNEPAAGFERL